jgi:hypothetical protein
MGMLLSRRTALQMALAGKKAEPRGSADCVIFLNLQGGPPQMDTWDVKEGKWAPENRDVITVKQGYQFPRALMPKMIECLDDVLMVRSMEAWETVHSRGQYYLQTGHAVSPARVKESPSMGSVIAFEAAKTRKESDYLPPFVSMNYEASTMYGPLIREGCLPADASPLTLDLASGSLPFLLEDSEKDRFAKRWAALMDMDAARNGLKPDSPQEMRQFASFARAVEKMMRNPQVKQVLAMKPEEKLAYGGTPFGDACLLARNMAAAKAGAKFIMVTQPGWDLHGNLYGKDLGKSATGGVYKLAKDLDAAMSALLFDLKRMGLLDRTLVIAMGEFGRTPGDLTSLAGREHYAKAMVAAFAGAGVKGGRVMGATDAEAANVTNFGWKKKRPIYVEDVCATVYSVLGIDANSRIRNTPSGRDFVYVDPAAGTRVIDFGEVSEFFA